MKFQFKKLKRILCLAISLMLLLTLCVSAETSANYDEVPFENYTYWNDLTASNSKKAVSMQPLYQASKVIEAKDLSTETLAALNDVFCSKNGYIYILDSDLPAIIVLNSEYELVNVIRELKDANGNSVSFKGSTSLFVTEQEKIYLCGTENACVWITDTNGNIENTLYLPDSEIIPKDFVYAPMKVAVDTRGYTYVLSRGSYYGAILYSAEEEFLGFYGANTVEATLAQVVTTVWNKLFMNDIKKAAMVKSLPYQFTDLDVGLNNFIYTTTGSTTDTATGQIKVLNPAGKNVIKKKDYNYTDGVAVKVGKNSWIGQNMSQLAADDQFIYVLDVGQGKIFLYDIESNLLGVFGGGFSRGSQKGLSKGATAIAVNGDDVVVVDKVKACLTIYSITEYGKLVKEAQSLTLDSKYLDAREGWNKVLKADKNSQLAYRGLARAALREKDYKEAMRLAKIAADRPTYSEAFETYRKNLIADNFAWAFPLILVIIAGVAALFIMLKKKGIKLIRGQNLSHYFYTLTHPFDGFGQVIEKKMGSTFIGTVLVALLYVSDVLKTTSSGFAYSYFNPVTFNALYVLVRTIGVVVLWTLVNWAVSTLLGGLGTIRNIYIVITYSLTPLIVSNFAYLLLSNIVLKAESGLLGIMVAVFWIYTIFLLIAGSIKVHDYSFGRFILTAILTIIGILIVIFLVFIIFLLMQQFVIFLGTVASEIIYR